MVAVITAEISVFLKAIRAHKPAIVTIDFLSQGEERESGGENQLDRSIELREMTNDRFFVSLL